MHQQINAPGFVRNQCRELTDISQSLIEFFRIEFYRLYRICRICRKLFLVIFIFKITKINILQKTQIL